MTPTVKTLVNQPYKYGFVTNIESDTIPRGLDEDVIRLISAKKKEPQFMLDFRLRAYRKWLTMQEPVWADLNFPPIDYQNIIYYSAPKLQAKKQSLDEVDPTLLEAFEKLGISLSEQKRLSNVAVDAVFDSVSIATTYKESLAKEGVIFCSISEAVAEHPELIEKYLGSVVPVGDNFFAALNSAVFSDGSFVYVPKGVKCPMDLSTYFRINNGDSGQFERTLIITEEGASVTYLEGCHPAGEQILTPTGWTNIEAIKPGDLVYDHNGDTQKVRASMVRQFKGDMITIRPMSRFNEFRLTPEHPVYAIKRQDVLVKRKQRKDHWLPEVDTKKLLKAEPQWIKADELQKGDFVLVPKLHHPEISHADYSTDWLISNDLPQIHYQARRLNLNVLTEQAQAKINGSVAVQEKPQQLLSLSEQSDRIINRQPLYQVGYTPDKKWDMVRETETHFIVPIKEIERQAYDDLVFNIDVDNTHSYLARGVAVHNCTAPMFDTNQLHAAVVELVALDNAEIKYSTVQNWYAGDENGKGGIYNFVTKRGICKGVNSKISWTQVETGSAITWKYPSCVLVGDNSVGEFYSVALTNNKQQADTGTKMVHIGNNTRSTIISKGISAGNSANSYRGLVKVNPKAAGARNYSQCDSMLIGDRAQANTFPYIQVENSTAKVEHEASTSKIGEDQLFYFAQRGISAEDAVSMIISGFCRDVFNKLPMEFAAEADKLLSLKLEGTVG